MQKIKKIEGEVSKACFFPLLPLFSSNPTQTHPHLPNLPSSPYLPPSLSPQPHFVVFITWTLFLLSLTHSPLLSLSLLFLIVTWLVVASTSSSHYYHWHRKAFSLNQTSYSEIRLIRKPWFLLKLPNQKSLPRLIQRATVLLRLPRTRTRTMCSSMTPSTSSNQNCLTSPSPTIFPSTPTASSGPCWNSPTGPV